MGDVDRRTGLGIAAGAALGPFIVTLLPAWMTIALAAIGAVLIVIRAAPRPTIIGLGFLVAAVPKSGVRFNALPLPFMFFGLGLALAAILRSTSSSRVPAGVQRVLVVGGLWVGGRLVLTAAGGGSLAQVVAVAAWAVLPAAVLAGASKTAVTDAARRLRRNWGAAMELGVMVACVYAVLQALAGLEATRIPGLTIAWGDSYAGKHIALIIENYEPFSKIPSTYQNGNVLGVVTAFFFVVAATRIAARAVTRWDLALLGLSGLASLLAGSRTVLIAIAAAGLASAASRTPLQRKVCLGVAAVGFGLVAVALQPGLAARFSLSSLTDTAGAGRTEQWAGVLRSSGFRLLTGTEDWVSTSLAEGAVGAFQQIGVVGVILLVFLAVRVTSRPGLEVWRIPLLVVGVSFALDSSYLVFPTLFIPAARMWAPLHLVRRDRPTTSTSGSTPLNGRRSSSAPCRATGDTRCGTGWSSRW